MMLGNRGAWLGQVRLVQRPWMGNIAEKFPTPPADAKPPANGCQFVGGRSIMNTASIDARIKDAQAIGLTDIQELDVPPCDPAKSFGCDIVGGNPPFKYVWACPGKQASSEAPATSPSPTTAPMPASFSAGTALAVGGGLAAVGLLAFLAFR